MQDLTILWRWAIPTTGQAGNSVVGQDTTAWLLWNSVLPGKGGLACLLLAIKAAEFFAVSSSAMAQSTVCTAAIWTYQVTPQDLSCTGNLYSAATRVVSRTMSNKLAALMHCISLFTSALIELWQIHPNSYSRSPQLWSPVTPGHSLWGWSSFLTISHCIIWWNNIICASSFMATLYSDDQTPLGSEKNLSPFSALLTFVGTAISHSQWLTSLGLTTLQYR